MYVGLADIYAINCSARFEKYQIKCTAAVEINKNNNKSLVRFNDIFAWVWYSNKSNLNRGGTTRAQTLQCAGPARFKAGRALKNTLLKFHK